MTLQEPLELIPQEAIEKRILLIRGHKVILDADLAWLYQVPTKVLNQAIRRNPDRFPEDFVFQLTEEEKQEVVTICDHLPKLKFTPGKPHVFTEHGAIMAASVLNSARAVKVSVYVVRVFVGLRQLLLKNRSLSDQMAKLEGQVQNHDLAIRSLAKVLQELTEPALSKKRRRIGI